MPTDTKQINEPKKIYVLLIRTRSAFSQIVHVLTRAEYTHASLCLDGSCKELYSFARENRLPLPAGFVVEKLDRGFMGKSRNAPCAMYELEVTYDSYKKLLKILDCMIRRKGSLKFSIYGSIACFFNLVSERKDKFFCSQFVAHTLERSEAIIPIKKAPLYRPIDFTRQPELKLIYKGTLGELSDSLRKPEEAVVS